MRCNRRSFTALIAVLMVCAPIGSIRAQSAPADPYARYTIPGRCVQAMGRLMQRYWRDKRQDTATFHTLVDTIPTTILASARACAARFDVRTVAVRDLPDLAQLYYWTRQDSLADSAVALLFRAPPAQLGMQAGWTSPGWLLRILAINAISARPIRLETAERYLRQLDALDDPSAAPWRMQAYQQLALRWLAEGNVAKGRDAAMAAFRASQAMVRSERIDRVYEMAEQYNTLAEPVSLLDSGPAAVALFDSARVRLSPLRAPGTGGPFDPRLGTASMELMQHVFGDSDGAEAPKAPPNADQLQLQEYIANLQLPYTMVGHPAAAVTATHWSPAGDTAPRPRAGVVTLVVGTYANCGGSCYSRYAVLRRLHAEFGARGLSIVMLAPTQGYFRNQPTPSPAQEADSVRRYLIDFLKLPGTLGVEETKFSFRDDGIRLNMPGETRRDYFKGRDAVVVGPDGIVREVVSLDVPRERMVRDVIAALTTK